MDCSGIENAGIIVSPNTDQKVKARIAAMRLKHGVPYFKDVLRKRFRDRIKESRSSFVSRLRDITASPSPNVFSVIQQEVSKILKNDDLSLMDLDEASRESIEYEHFPEQENWLMQQYDLFMADDNTVHQFWEESQLVVCPVCKRGSLMRDAIHLKIHCDTCSMIVPARALISEIEDRIYQCISIHSDLNCESDTFFFVSHEDSTLYAHCNACSYLDVVV